MMLRIKEILKEKGMTQKQLAEKLGKAESTLMKIINGNPTLSSLQEIATALDVPLTELILQPSPQKDIYGFLEIDGEVKKITTLQDLEDIKLDKDNE